MSIHAIERLLVEERKLKRRSTGLLVIATSLFLLPIGLNIFAKLGHPAFYALQGAAFFVLVGPLLIQRLYFTIATAILLAPWILALFALLKGRDLTRTTWYWGFTILMAVAGASLLVRAVTLVRRTARK